MPDITTDERGRRLFKLHREKAVESAIEKIRQNMGDMWKLFSDLDIEILSYILGEVWISVDRRSWDRYTFSRLMKRDLEKIISIGKDVKRGDSREQTAVDEVIRILGRAT